MSSDLEEQQDELLALTNILAEDVFSDLADDTGRGGTFYSHIQLPENFALIFETPELNCSDNTTQLHQIKYLPPLMLNFQLPSDYPSTSSPTFTLTCKWLSLDQLSQLCRKLDEIWEENQGNVILFSWTNFLQDDLYSFLQLQSPLNVAHVVSRRKHSAAHADCPTRKHDVRAIQDIASQALLQSVLMEFNVYQCDMTFGKSLVACGVCFGEKYGVQCSRFFPCLHAFCKACMREYFCVQITDGNVASISCPHDKCTCDAHPSQIKELVPAEVFSRYDSLLLEMSLQTMVDIIYCPRPSCQSAVIFDSESGMASCPCCQFVFCPLCRFTYHGVSPCRVKRKDMRDMRDEYIGADDATRGLMERRYGKSVLTNILHEAFSEEWLEENSHQCPRCGTHIQKIDGCNKMTCTKCRAFFCWLCGEPLSRNNPYDHFNNPDSPCVHQLFAGDIDLEDDVDF